MKTIINKPASSSRVIRLGSARRQTKASFTGTRAELVHPDLVYTPGG